MWSLLKRKDLKDTIATDLKLANVLTGRMSHGSTFPWTWCASSKDELNTCGKYTTVGNFKENVSFLRKR